MSTNKNVFVLNLIMLICCHLLREFPPTLEIPLSTDQSEHQVLGLLDIRKTWGCHIFFLHKYYILVYLKRICNLGEIAITLWESTLALNRQSKNNLHFTWAIMHHSLVVKASHWASSVFKASSQCWVPESYLAISKLLKLFQVITEQTPTTLTKSDNTATLLWSLIIELDFLPTWLGQTCSLLLKNLMHSKLTSAVLLQSWPGDPWVCLANGKRNIRTDSFLFKALCGHRNNL